MEKSTLYKILLTIGVVLGGGGFLVYSSIGDAQHYMMVDELVGTNFTGWTDKELKVHGFVEAGTIVESSVGQVVHRTFVLQKNGRKIRIFNEGPKPDTFKDQSEVVATGRLVKATDLQALAAQMCETKDHAAPIGCPLRVDAEQTQVLESSELMAKCPSKYDGAPTTKIDTQFKP